MICRYCVWVKDCDDFREAIMRDVDVAGCGDYEETLNEEDKTTGLLTSKAGSLECSI